MGCLQLFYNFRACCAGDWFQCEGLARGWTDCTGKGPHSPRFRGGASQPQQDRAAQPRGNVRGTSRGRGASPRCACRHLPAPSQAGLRHFSAEPPPRKQTVERLPLQMEEQRPGRTARSPVATQKGPACGRQPGRATCQPGGPGRVYQERPREFPRGLGRQGVGHSSLASGSTSPTGPPPPDQGLRKCALSQEGRAVTCS